MPAARKTRERKSIDHGNEGGRRVSPAYLPWPWGVWYERIEMNLLCQSRMQQLSQKQLSVLLAASPRGMLCGPCCFRTLGGGETELSHSALLL